MKKIVLLLLLPINLFAANYYVTQSGTGDGSTPSTPDSIADFNSNVFGDLADDTVYFDGTFTTGLNTPAGCTGTSGHYATLDLSTATWQRTTNGHQLVIDQAYVKVQNALSVQNANAGVFNCGINITGANVWVDNCNIIGRGAAASYNYNQGIYIEDGANGFLLTRNTITDCCVGIHVKTAGIPGTIGGSAGNGNTITSCTAPPVDDADGIDIGSSNGTPEVEDYTGLTISYNTISEWGDDGVDLYYGMNVVVEYNNIGPFTSTDAGVTDGNGVKAGSTTNATGNTIRNNNIHDLTSTYGDNYGITTNGTDHVNIYNNYMYNCVYGILLTASTHGHNVYNNTTYSCTERGISAADSVTETIIQNNICDGGTYDLITNAGDVITGGYNCFKNDRHSLGGTYTDTGASDLHGVDPGITSRVLPATSPVKNRGVTNSYATHDITGRLRLEPYDIGCWEAGDSFSMGH